MAETMSNLVTLGFDNLRHGYELAQSRTEVVSEDATAQMNTAALIEHGGTNGTEACIESVRSKDIYLSNHVNSTPKFRTLALLRRNDA